MTIGKKPHFATAVLILYSILSHHALGAKLTCESIFRDSEFKSKMIYRKTIPFGLNNEMATSLFHRTREHANPLRDSGAPNLPAAIYSFYVRSRLGYLSSYHRRTIENVMQNQTDYQVHSRPDLASSRILNAAGGRDGIKITLPITIAGTIIDYAIRVHELEHVIQSLHLANGDRSFLHPLHFAQNFERELGAIVAESIILLAATPYEISSLLEGVQTSKLPKEDLTIISTILEDSLKSKSPEDYLKQQWKRGRYSRWHYTKKQLEVYLGLGVVGTLGYWGYSLLF